MNAIAAADFKNGFGSQFVQPFPDTDALYSSYSHYNNWAAKVPSPLGTKTFPWPVNPLGSVVSTNHHQNSINCFNTSSPSVAAQNMLSGSMGTALSGSSGTTGVTPCYTPTNPYTMYHHRTTAEPCTAMSSSIATLRLKAKQHQSGFASPYSTQSSVSPVSRSNSGSLSACQYAGVTDSVWDNVLVGTLLSSQTSLSSLSHLQLLNNNEPKSDDDSMLVSTNLHFETRDFKIEHHENNNCMNTEDDDENNCTSENNTNNINDHITD